MKSGTTHNSQEWTKYGMTNNSQDVQKMLEAVGKRHRPSQRYSDMTREKAPVFAHSDRKLVSNVLRHPRDTISNRLRPRPNREFQLNDTKPAVGVAGELVIIDDVVRELTVVVGGRSTAGGLKRGPRSGRSGLRGSKPYTGPQCARRRGRGGTTDWRGTRRSA